jgi:hypothetical protein
MIAPIAALIFASAMALSLSVEGESFFHTPATTRAEPSEGEPSAPTNGVDAPDDSSPDPLGEPLTDQARPPPSPPEIHALGGPRAPSPPGRARDCCD